jgi:membrane associated rhomboid family serine protease
MGRARSPTAALLVVLVGVYLAQVLLSLVDVTLITFALSTPLDERPWTLVTSVYAHSSLSHLLANALALVVLGLAIERVTTPVRFHLFFLLTGMAAGVTEVLVASALGQQVAVVGASGAVFALLGYGLTGNALAGAVLSRLSRRLRLALLAGLAIVVTLATAAPGVAVLAHFSGFVLGAAAGRERLLHKS